MFVLHWLTVALTQVIFISNVATSYENFSSKRG